MQEESYQPQDEPIYISESSESEGAEKTLYTFSTILKIIGYLSGILCVLGGIYACKHDKSFTPYIVSVLVGAIVWLLFMVYASVVKVFANISMSLKDITKLLNR